LVIGLVSFAAIVGLSFCVLVFARVGRLHGSTFRLYALTGEARGVIHGSEVWLDGQKVGVVKNIDFMPPGRPLSERLLITMDVLSSAREGIRHNSTAQIRSGGTLISSPVVYLTIGTTASTPVASGDTVRTLPQSDVETMTSRFAIASREFPAIINNIKLLNDQLHSVNGTLGAMGIEHGGVELVQARRQAMRVGVMLAKPRGTIGAVFASQGALIDRARRVMTRADSVRAVIANKNTSLGRLRSDSALMREVADIRNELDIVQARMASPTGTLGRIRADSALFDAIAKAQRELTLIMADVRRRPLRYIHF
jgi:phospholipid/cholesterol/gamma-HCH transport system substrate-binding protein